MDEAVSKEALEAARGYEALFVRALTGVWTEHVLTSAQLAPGHRLLDVACGTGVLARAAQATVGRNGSVTGLDPAAGMIAVAREITPEITWLLGAAEQLDLPDCAFDRVTSQFGLMFFLDREAAVAEMHRVLVPQGRIALAVWTGLDRNPAYSALASLFDERISQAAGEALRIPFCMGDAHALMALLEAAGFQDITIETPSEEANFPSPRALVEAELRGWLPFFDIHLDDAKIAEVLAAADHVLAPYTTSTGEARFPTAAHVVCAVKP
ncbi:MAG: methyltransferase domain-containing protein [Pseudomonadota bacterium]